MQDPGPDQATVLTPEDHDRFIDQGFIFLPGLVRREKATAAAEALEAGGDKDSPVVRMCVTDRVVDAVRELVGVEHGSALEEASYIDHARRYEPDQDWGRLGPHADSVYPTVLSEVCGIGAFIFLTPVKSRGGAFLYAAESPRRLAAVAAAQKAESLWGAYREESKVGSLVECIAEPGDVILFGDKMVHSASVNVSDPATRHALRVSWTSGRIFAPGAKSLADMATAEKAVSVRYLHERYGDEYAYQAFVPDDTATAHLRQGIGSRGGIVSHDITRFRGVNHLFYVDAADPAVIGHRTTRNWVDWSEDAPLRLTSERIHGIHLEHRFSPTLTVVTTVDGAHRSRRFCSEDLVSWRQRGTVLDKTFGRPHYAHSASRDGSRPYTNVIYEVPDERPHELWWRCGTSQEDMGTWIHRNLATSVPEGGRIADAAVHALVNQAELVLVTDVVGPDGTDRAYFSQVSSPETPGTFPDPQPVVSAEGAGPVRRIRLYERARRYWLVTYQREQNGKDRIFWGAIDWAVAPGQLQPLRSAAEFQQALYIIGLQ